MVRLSFVKYILGALFIKENICKIETGNVENMTCGFEIVFPALLEKAQHLDIDIPYDAPVLKNICARREMKFKRYLIPSIVLFRLTYNYFLLFKIVVMSYFNSQII